MKRLYVLITTQNTPALCEVLFWKKSRKITQNDHFSKMRIFFHFFLIFKVMGLCRELGFFAL
jgi:hypothetical protein